MNEDAHVTGWNPNEPSPPAQPAGQPPAPLASPSEVEGGYKEGIGYGLWCLFAFGFAGIHRFYVGKYGTGLLWLLTWGLFGVGQLLDLFRMKSLVREANVREGYLPHPRYARQLQTGAPPQQLASAPPQQGQSVMHSLLRAAKENGGALTVTQGVLATGLSFEQVESVLREMVSKGYVDVDNAPDSGVIVYRFPELTTPLL